MDQRKALIRRPSPRLAEGIVTHIDREPLDLELAERQWQGYVDALHKAGWQTIEVEPAPDCPDGVFVEDTVLVYGDLAVLTNPGADARKPEVAGTEVVVRDLGYRIARITEPGTLDGGDVLKHGGIVWVGEGGRTNAAGIEQLRGFLEPEGARVIAVPLEMVLHLKSAVTALPDGTIIGYEPLVDDVSVYGDRFLAVPEESGAHVVLLGDNTLLMAADAPQSAQLFRDRGYTVIETDISEYEKLEGCVTCLSVRLRGCPS